LKAGSIGGPSQSADPGLLEELVEQVNILRQEYEDNKYSTN